MRARSCYVHLREQVIVRRSVVPWHSLPSFRPGARARPRSPHFAVHRAVSLASSSAIIAQISASHTRPFLLRRFTSPLFYICPHDLFQSKPHQSKYEAFAYCRNVRGRRGAEDGEGPGPHCQHPERKLPHRVRPGAGSDREQGGPRAGRHGRRHAVRGTVRRRRAGPDTES